MEEIKFVPQCKGVDADKASIRDDELFYCSIKYYGIYVQICKAGDEVAFFTSSGKRFVSHLADEFKKLDFDFRIETEYFCGDGKLDATMLAKADNEIKKVVKDGSFELTGKFMIFDVLDFNNSHNFDYDFRLRLQHFQESFNDASSKLKFAINHLATYSSIKDMLIGHVKSGYEGLFLKRATHINIPGKKSKDAIKLKPIYTVDLPITSIVKNWLWCTDKQGRVAKVQVGHDEVSYYKIGDTIEIQYEQIAKTYVQAKFVRARYDKMA